MPRRKKKKLKQDGDWERHKAPVTTSIEDDLRQQRMRQQQRQEEEEKEKAVERSDPMIEEEQVEVEIVKPHVQQLLLKGAFPIQPILNRYGSSLSLACLLEQSPSLNARYRHNLRQVWHSKYLLEHIHINRRASVFYNRNQLRWMDHSLPDGIFCAWDMACKHNLHTSSRTLDVGLFGEDCLPSIATAVQGGWALMKHPQEPERGVCTMRR
jgi:hypothetical protein